MIRKIKRLSKDALDMFKYNAKSKKINDNKYKNMWLICERGTEAKDNGYVFFKYLRKEHPEINAWYVIDKNCKNDYDRVKDYKNIIQYNSEEHKIAFLLCEKLVSSHIGFIEPWSYKLYKLLLDRADKKQYVLLQHGVITNDLSEHYSKKQSRVDRFITTTRKEYESVCGENYGYSKGEVVMTGLPRYDNLNEFETKNQILLMPTWRTNIVSPSYNKSADFNDDIFKQSEYFKRYNSIINNKKLGQKLKEKGCKLIFYPHYEIQDYIKFFKTDIENVIVAKKDDYEVQKLLKESNLLITDYSSVNFDFAYMRKPIIYYHYEKVDQRYKKGYFEYKDDGFGNLVDNEEDLVDEIFKYMDSDYKMNQKYLDRINKSFNIRDDKNCERTFNVVKELKK